MTQFNDYYLRGDTESDVLACMDVAGIPTAPTLETSFDPIGTIWVDDQPIPGWHANIRLRQEMTAMQAQALAPVLIPPPANPIRVWA